MDRLYERFRITLNETETSFVRFLHEKIDWKARMIAILGERGVGKTTMLFQHIKLYNNVEDTLFVYADDMYFSENKLHDLASDFYKNGGKHLYIDEIHKYKDWSVELKMIYDSFPKLQVVFTGSSILELYKGAADLSRRVLLYNLPGLSFREYLNFSRGLDLPAYTLDEILANKVEATGIEHPLPLFKEYSQRGYYPFFGEGEYEQRLNSIINQSLETDIPMYAQMNISSAKKLKQLLYIVAQSVPFKPNYTKIAEKMGVSRNSLADMMYYLEKAGVIMQLRNRPSGISELGKVEKVYLGNTNISYAISEEKPDTGNLRETLFMSQTSVMNKVYIADRGDFMIGRNIFEVGGRNKKQKQIAEMPDAYLVKDDIEYGYKNALPLWAFGFIY